MNDIQVINVDTTNNIPKRKIPKDLSASVFNYVYKWTTWGGFWRNVGRFFRCWKPAWHRATKGYCRMDTWDVNYSLTTYLIQVLIEYRNVTNGWPFPHFQTFEHWIAALDECIDNLIYSIKDTDDEELCPHYAEWREKCSGKYSQEQSEEQVAIRRAYMEEVNAAYEKQYEARKKAFEFIGEYLPFIWW